MSLDIVSGINRLRERTGHINSLLNTVVRSRQVATNPQGLISVTGSFKSLKTEGDALLLDPFTREFERSPLVIQTLEGNTEEIQKLPDESINLVLEFVLLLGTIYDRNSISSDVPLDLQKTYATKSRQFGLVALTMSHQIEERRKDKKSMGLQTA